MIEYHKKKLKKLEIIRDTTWTPRNQSVQGMQVPKSHQMELIFNVMIRTEHASIFFPRHASFESDPYTLNPEPKDSSSDKRLSSASAFLGRCAGVQVCRMSRRKIYSQTNKYKGMCAGVQVSRCPGCPGERFTLKQTNTRAGVQVNRRTIYSQTNVYPSASAFLGRCAGVQVCRMSRRKIYSQTNKYKGMCAGVQVSRRPWQMACSSLSRWSAPVTHSAAWGSNFWVFSKNFCSFGQSTMYTRPRSFFFFLKVS